MRQDLLNSMVLVSDVIDRVTLHRDKSKTDSALSGVYFDEPNEPPHRNRHEFRDGGIDVRNSNQVTPEFVEYGIPIRRVGGYFVILDTRSLEVWIRFLGRGREVPVSND